MGTHSPSFLPQEVARRCASRARIFAFEPLRENAELLNDVLKPLILKKSSEDSQDDTHVSVHVLNMAVTGRRGLDTIGFDADCDRGAEVCGVSSTSKHQVQATTMDEWFEKQLFPQVDIMVIDAEGHDPDILDGARDMLMSQAVRVLVFEYHHVGTWASRELRSVVSRLDVSGYDCFLLQQGATALRLTKCWNSAFEFKDWSNVMCVLRKEAPLLATMNSFIPLRLL